MPYVKIDANILRSSVWPDRDRRSVWFTMLVMALPESTDAPTQAYDVDTMQPTWMVPAGNYGLVSAASEGIAREDGCSLDCCLTQLRSLAAPDMQSRSPDFDGRRVARVAGGYLVLNYGSYRDRLRPSSTEKVRKWRERKKQEAQNRETTATADVTVQPVTQPHAVSSMQYAVSSNPPVVPPVGGRPMARASRSTATANSNGHRNGKRPPRRNAVQLVAQIRKLRDRKGGREFIPHQQVSALGDDVYAAYMALGGAERFLSCPDAKLGLLAKDFAAALRTPPKRD